MYKFVPRRTRPVVALAPGRFDSMNLSPLPAIYGQSIGDSSRSGLLVLQVGSMPGSSHPPKSSENFLFPGRIEMCVGALSLSPKHFVRVSRPIRGS